MKKKTERTVYQGEWLSVSEQVFENKDGIEIIWETVNRKKSSVGVVIVARLMPSRKFILVKQFRPAVHGYIIGFPAGLAFGDPNHALVELKEETGYTGKIIAASPVLKTGSSLINDSGRIVFIEVDEHDPVNKDPQQHLEPSEDITVCLVDKNRMKEFLLEQDKNGVYISSNLWYTFGLSEWTGQ